MFRSITQSKMFRISAVEKPKLLLNVKKSQEFIRFKSVHTVAMLEHAVTLICIPYSL